MKIPAAFALLSALATGGCALLFGSSPHDDALVKTQVMPEPLAACAASRLNVAPTAMANGAFAIGVADTQLIIMRNDVQTVVREQNGGIVPSSVSEAVVQCALALTPSTNKTN